MLRRILEVVIANAALPPTEIMSAVCAAFPNEPYALIAGYIYQLGKKGYLAVESGDDRIIAVAINPSAYVALHEMKNKPEEKSSPQIHIGNISEVRGQLAIGNRGGSYDMHVSENVINAMSGGLEEVITLADKQSLNLFERERIKKIAQQIIESLDKAESPSQNLIEQLDSFLQKHSWISAPLAAAFLNALTKLF